MTSGIRVHHLALRVTDPEASAAFYSGLLGLPEVSRRAGIDGVRAIWLRAGDVILMLERALRGEGPSAGSGHLLAFAASGLDEWERRLASAGISVVDRTAHTLYFSDPDNHRLAVSVYKEDP